MSFNAKNLTYGMLIHLCKGNQSADNRLATEKKEPNFLRRLREQNVSGDSARHERPIGRPDRPKRLQLGGPDDDEDEPTYVDEETNETVSREEYQTLLDQAPDVPKDAAENQDSVNSEAIDSPKKPSGLDAAEVHVGKSTEKLADVGDRRKKRVVKVIGDDDQGRDTRSEVVSDANAQEPDPRPPAKGRKKKRIKLSFDEEHDGGRP